MEGCKMVKPYLNQVGGKVENDVNLFTGGLNTYVDKGFIDADQMPYVMNMTMYQPPMISTRPTRRTMAYGFNPQVMPTLNTIVEMFAISETDILIVTTDGSTSTLRRLYRDGDHWSKQDVGTVPNADHYFFTRCVVGPHRYIYIGNETFKIRVDANSYNPLTIKNYNEPGDSDHYGIPVWHKGRLWLARPSKNEVEWSNVLAPDDFLIGEDPQDPTHRGFSGTLYANTAKGFIQNIVSFDDKLMILCEHSIHAVYGSSGNATNQNYFQVVDVNNNLGVHSPTCIAVGGGRMFWLGDDYEVYEYTGSALNMISRPASTRYTTISKGGISNLFTTEDNVDYNNNACMTATATKLYFNIGLNDNRFLFVFDIFNKVWWCEDGEFTTIADYSEIKNTILMAKPNGDILVSYERWGDGNDYVFNFDTNTIVEEPIKYEFHTRVYGADGTDSRKSISDVWFQASANATVYLSDIWTARDKWKEYFGDEWALPAIENNYEPIGTLEEKYQSIDQLQTYRDYSYEQQVCHVPKMYGERLNAFQIIVKGIGTSKFYLMKREWRAR